MNCVHQKHGVSQCTLCLVSYGITDRPSHLCVEIVTPPGYDFININVTCKQALEGNTVTVRRVGIDPWFLMKLSQSVNQRCSRVTRYIWITKFLHYICDQIKAHFCIFLNLSQTVAYLQVLVLMNFVSFNFYCPFILILSHLILKLHNCFA